MSLDKARYTISMNATPEFYSLMIQKVFKLIGFLMLGINKVKRYGKERIRRANNKWKKLAVCYQYLPWWLEKLCGRLLLALSVLFISSFYYIPKYTIILSIRSLTN